jgi:hypothetical protein
LGQHFIKVFSEQRSQRTQRKNQKKNLELLKTRKFQYKAAESGEGIILNNEPEQMFFEKG